jgi:hypothetical protein
MKQLSLAVLAVGLIATTASADVTSSSITAHPGTFGTPNVNGGVESIAIESLEGGRSTPYTLGSEGYDNWPSFLGGAGAHSLPGGTPGTFAFYRWNNPTAQWGDDVHGYVGGSMDHLHYGFLDVPTVPGTHIASHTIKIFDMVPPSAGHSPPTFTNGVQYTSLVVTYTLTNSVNAFYTATISFPQVALISDSMWVDFSDPANNTFWLTGGRPTIAPNYSHPGIVYAPPGFNYFVYYPYLTTGYGAPLNANIGMALGIPEPVTISFLALSGLLVLRRRRVRA